MPVRSLLVGVGQVEQGRLRKVRPDELQPHRQPVGKAAGDGHRRQAGNVGRQGVDVHQVHLQRVVHPFPDGEGGYRGHRRRQGVNPLKNAGKILPDEGTGLLRLPIVSVIVAGRKGKSPQHNAPLHLGAEPVLPGAFHRRPHIALALVGITVLDAIVARQVGGAFGGGDDVVAGQGVFRSGQGYLPDFGAQIGQLADGGGYGGAHAGVHTGVRAISEIFRRHPNAPSGNIPGKGAAVVGYDIGQGGGIAGVAAGDGLQYQGAVGGVPGQRPNLIQRRGVGHQPVAADPPVGGLEAGDAATGRRLPNAAAGVGAQGKGGGTGGHCGRRTAAAAAGDAGGVPGVAGGEKGGVFGG